jgi:hypothetical protein
MSSPTAAKLAAAVAALLLAVPAAATATTTATRSGNAITITGDDGPNLISVNSVGDFIMYEDKGGPSIVAGAGCFQENPSLINCGQGGLGLKATVTLGGGDDVFDDRLPRTDWPTDAVDAGAGDDIVNGSYGDDVLRGGSGDDVLRGISGNDHLLGEAGNDQLHGGAGDDTVDGGPGRDSINGDGDYSTNGLAAGNDTILARDGEVDQVACGFGADSAVLDAADVVDLITDCEAVDRPVVPAAGGGGAPPPATAPPPPAPAAPVAPAVAVAVARPGVARLGALAQGKAMSFKVTLSQACAATITLTVAKAQARRAHLGAGAVVLARAVRALPAGTVTTALTVKKAYRAKLARISSLQATLKVACAGTGAATATQALALRR